MASLWTGLFPHRTGVVRFQHGLPEAALHAGRDLPGGGLHHGGHLAQRLGGPELRLLAGLRPLPRSRRRAATRQGFSGPRRARAGSPAPTRTHARRDRVPEPEPSEKFLLYAHYMDVHQYAYDDEAAALGFGASLSDSYDASIHWVDSNIYALLVGARRARPAEEDAGRGGRRPRRGLPRARARGPRDQPLPGGRPSVPLIFMLPVPPRAGARGRARGPQRGHLAHHPRPRRPAAAAADRRRLAGPADAGGREGAEVETPMSMAYLDQTWGRIGAEPAPLISIRNDGQRLLYRPKQPGGVRDLRPRERIPGELHNLTRSRPEWAEPLKAGARDAARAAGALGRGGRGEGGRHGTRPAPRARLRDRRPGPPKQSEPTRGGAPAPWRAALAAARCCACGRLGATPGDAPERVVLVTIDTLRADHVGCYGAPQARDARRSTRSPRAGARFETAISPAPLTLPSHATLLTALDPPEHGVRSNGALPAARRDPDAGRAHARARASPARPSSPRSCSIGASAWRAASTSTTTGSACRTKRSGVASRARRPRRSTLRSPGSTTRPSASSCSSISTTRTRPTSRPSRTARGSSAAPTTARSPTRTRELGRLLAAVEARFPDGRSLVVVTADHGESLGEHGEPTHAFTLYDATQRVPLLMAGPGVPAGVVVQPARAARRRGADRARAGRAAGAAGRDGREPAARAARRARRRAARGLGRDARDAARARLEPAARRAHGATTSTCARPAPSSTTLASDPGETKNLAAEQPELARASSTRSSRRARRAAARDAEPRASTPRRRSSCARSATWPTERPLASAAPARRGRRARPEGRDGEARDAARGAHAAEAAARAGRRSSASPSWARSASSSSCCGERPRCWPASSRPRGPR